MKGAEPAVVGTRLFKANVLANNLGDVNLVKQDVNKR